MYRKLASSLGAVLFCSSYNSFYGLALLCFCSGRDIDLFAFRGRVVVLFPGAFVFIVVNSQ